MIKSMKKILALILALCLVMSMLAGCGNSSENVEDTGEKKDVVSSEGYEYQDVEITISGPQGATDDWDSTVLVQTMKEKFGVSLICEPYPTDAWSTKLSLLLAEDDLPDLVVSSGLSAMEANKYGQEEYFLNIADYLDHMPNLAAFLKAHPDYKAYCTAPDGGIYFLPTYQEEALNNIARAFIKTSWLENVGMDYPETADELYAVLKAFKEQDANGNGDPNDEIPMMWAGTYARTIEHSLLGMFGVLTSSATAKPYSILSVDENGQVYLADTTENFKAYLTYMHKLWEEDLIWNESYTTDINTQRELTKNDRVGIFVDASSYAAAGNGDPKDSQYYQYFAGLTSEYAEEPVLAYGVDVGTSAQILISALTEHPAEICRMIDWYFSDEGALFGWRGDVESYLDYVPLGFEGVEDVYVYAFKDEQPEGYESWEVYRHQVQVINSAFQIRNILQEDIAAIMEADDETLLKFAEAGQSGWKAMMQLRINQAGIEFVPGYPALVYDESVAIERNDLQTDISNYIMTVKAQFITGEKDIETEWDDFLKTLETMNLSRWLEIEQEAYDQMYG